MNKYRILYFGTWGYGRAGLKGLLNSKNVEIVQVYTKWDPYKPNKYMDQVKELAFNNNIPFFNTKREICSVKEFNNSILSHSDIDLLISCCFDRIFNQKVLRFPKIKALNVHPSLLPKYRGVKPLENAIVNGEKETGITIHELEKELDSGKIIHQIGGISIEETLTYAELYNNQCNVIINIIQEYFNNPQHFLNNAKPQDDSKVSWAPRLSFAINDELTVKEIREKVKHQKTNFH